MKAPTLGVVCSDLVVKTRRTISTLVNASGVGKHFGSVQALDSIDLQIRTGEIIGIVGPSGSGKTTTIRLLLGLYEPSQGHVEIFDTRSGDFSRVERERIGYLPQHFLLYEDLTITENLLFAAGIYGLGPRDRRERIPQLLDMLELTDAKDRLARDISGGMQRRVALAATLIHRPDLIVLDEPTSGLDPVLRESIWHMFEDLRQQGASLIVTTQYITETENCDRVVLLNEGRIVATGTPDELRDQVFGGEVVRLKSRDLTPELAVHLLSLDYVLRGQRTARDEIELIVEAAHEAMPRLNDEMRRMGCAIDELEEIQLSLDAVFVELVRNTRNSDRDALPD